LFWFFVYFVFKMLISFKVLIHPKKKKKNSLQELEMVY